MRLYFAIEVEIHPADRVHTAVQDPDLKEPVGEVKRPSTPIKLLAQKGLGQDVKLTASEGGGLLHADGYLVFRRLDLDELEYLPAYGDRIAVIAGDATDYYIHKLTRRGHKNGRWNLMKCWYSDQAPTRQRS